LGQEAKVISYPVQDFTEEESSDVEVDHVPAKTASTKQPRWREEEG
jgi:hypothetical protein